MRSIALLGISWSEVGQVETCFAHSLHCHGAVYRSGRAGQWKTGPLGQAHQRGAEHTGEWVGGTDYASKWA